jgi:hypothetical protein
MVHPELSLMAAVAAPWLGREALHAGAFVVDGGAWAVLGMKEAGKSSLLGLLAAQGVGIVTDDVLIVQDGYAFAGPRCVDLRKGAVDWLGQRQSGEIVQERDRWRVHLPPVAPALALRGWILPIWAECVGFERVPVAQRLPVIYKSLALARVPLRPQLMLRLATLPFLVFQRPRRWDMMEESAARLWDRVHELG